MQDIAEHVPVDEHDVQVPFSTAILEQGEQEDDAHSDHVPAGHVRQLVAVPPLEYVPAPHGEHPYIPLRKHPEPQAEQDIPEEVDSQTEQ